MTAAPALPPTRRSRPALGLTAPAAEGRFALQQCDDCGAVPYPPQEFCAACLSPRLAWRDMPREGELIAEADVHHSLEPAFGPQVPVRTGLVRHASGATLVCFLQGDCAVGGAVRLSLSIDAGGAPVVTAAPPEEAPMSRPAFDVAGRTCLVTEDRSDLAAACIAALTGAGAAEVIALPAEGAMRLDTQDMRAVQIVVDTAWLGLPERDLDAHLAASRALAGSLAPVLADRGGAWVVPLSFAALTPYPDCLAHSARMGLAQASVVSLRQRLQMGRGNALALYAAHPDVEDLASRDGAPLPPDRLAAWVVDALRDGLEETFPDPLARLWNDRLGGARKVLEREAAAAR